MHGAGKRVKVRPIFLGLADDGMKKWREFSQANSVAKQRKNNYFFTLEVKLPTPNYQSY